MPETPTRRIACPTCGRKTHRHRDGTYATHYPNGDYCDGSTAQYLALPWPKPPLSLNDRRHWAVKHRLTSEVRLTVKLLAHNAHLRPVQGHATVTLHYRPRDNRRRDKDNLYATIKPVIDGLRDAGVLADDDSTRVTPQVDIHGARAGMPGCCWIEISSGEES